MTQREKVIEKLITDGEVNNFWAIQNYILRLGAIICELTKDGWEFARNYGEGANSKNYFYEVTKYGNQFNRKTEKRVVEPKPEEVFRAPTVQQANKEDNRGTVQLDFGMVFSKSLQTRNSEASR